MPKELPVVLVADDERLFVELCGISMLERSLRILQRIGFRRATIVSAIPELVEQHLAKPSWARSEIMIAVLSRAQFAASTTRGLALVLHGDIYYGRRLLDALAQQQTPTILVDSVDFKEGCSVRCLSASGGLRAATSPGFSAEDSGRYSTLLEAIPRTVIGYVCGAALVECGELKNPDLFEHLAEAALRGEIGGLDVQDQPTYVVNLRRHLRPLWFPAPTREQIPLAENLLLDAAQNGTLDFPAKVHAPLETWIIARLCKTPITPNQITLFTAAVSLLTAVLFATGHLIAGTILALIVGVFDGLDGKQARVKVETTELGKREHLLDYVLELSWWTALAYRFAAFGPLFLLVASDLLDRWAKRIVKQRTGRNLDDLTSFDRFVRLIGGRRNIYIWMFAAGLLAGIPHETFLTLCGWAAVTAAVHVGRALSISWRGRGAE